MLMAAPGQDRRGRGQRWSERFDGGFRLQQDRDPVTDGIYPLAFVTLQAVLAAQHQRLAAYRTGEYLQQIGADHGCDLAGYAFCGYPELNGVTGALRQECITTQ